MSPLFDAHNHLHHRAFEADLDKIVQAMQRAGVERCVVNGTCENDWSRVAGLADRFPEFVQPSFGLHPWKISERSDKWDTVLADFLDRYPQAGIGECGLDRWKEPYDLDDQIRVFRTQIALAQDGDRPLSVHCLEAWGATKECLKEADLPKRGFLLHSYGGSREMVREFADLDAYFSFSGYFLTPRKEGTREAFRAVPSDRLLVETDAPEMLPPEEVIDHPLRNADGSSLNHPANLAAITDGLAQALECDVASLRERLATNFARFFGA